MSPLATTAARDRIASALSTPRPSLTGLTAREVCDGTTFATYVYDANGDLIDYSTTDL